METHNYEALVQALEAKRLEHLQKAKKVFPRSFFRVFLVFFGIFTLFFVSVYLFGDARTDNVGENIVTFIIGASLGSAVMGLFVGGIWTLLSRGKISNDFWDEVKEMTLYKLIEDLKLDMEYSPVGIKESVFRRAELFPARTVNSTDQLKSTTKEIVVAECESTEKRNSEEGISTAFRGLFVTKPTTVPKEMGPIKFIPNFGHKDILKITLRQRKMDASSSNRHLNRLQDDRITLNDSFEVYASNEIDAGSVLSDETLHQMGEIRAFLNDGKTSFFDTMLPSSVYFSFNEGHFHAAIYWHRDLFKGNVFLKTSLKETPFIENFEKDLQFIQELMHKVDQIS